MQPGFTRLRLVATLLMASFTAGTLGCGPAAPQGPPSQQQMPAPRRPGMTTGQKVLLLGGAAALYYLYRRHQNAKGSGPNGKYFLSKNGRVYYRDLKTGAFQWVDPPQQPISVTPEEYTQFTGQPAPMAPGGPGGVIRQAPAGWPPVSPAGSGGPSGPGGPPGPPGPGRR